MYQSRWSIVNQLGGKISIRSELGKGTDVEVTIPVEKASNVNAVNTGFNDPPNVLTDPKQCIINLQHRAAGKSIYFLRGGKTGNVPRHKDISWSCIHRYCSEWFGFEIKEASADITVTDREEMSHYTDGKRVLIVHDDMGCSTKQGGHSRYAVGNISSPIGPFKLARYAYS